MSAEKPFDPTPSRLQRAKRDGDVARSGELCAAAAFACALLCTAGVAPGIAAEWRVAIDEAMRGGISNGALAGIALIMLIPGAAAACGACGAAATQTGGFPLRTLKLDLQCLNPSENLKRMCSREAAFTAVRSLVAFAVAAIALVPVFASIFAASLRGENIAALTSIAWSGGVRTCATACAAGGCFALLDLGVQLVQWRKRLRMTHEEFKRDQKEQDGDPIARARRRAFHRRIARGSLARVKDAAFVVTNPTHIAIAIEYRPPSVAVPRVLVRAADETARRVRLLADEHRIPVLENVPLARALYASARAGEHIPQETYVAVAEIVIALRDAVRA